MHLAYSGDQLLGPRVLEQVAQRAGADGRKDLVVAAKARQHQDASVWLGGHDVPGGLQPVHAGHDNVHQHHVGLQVLDRGDGLVPVACLAGHLDAWLGGEQGRDAPADDGVIVHHQDAYGTLDSGLWYGLCRSGSRRIGHGCTFLCRDNGRRLRPCRLRLCGLRPFLQPHWWKR